MAANCNDTRPAEIGALAEEQAILRRHFGGFQGQQAGRNIGGLHLKLIRADDERVALLGLRVERSRAGERECVALRLERAFISREQRVRARDRRLQMHHVSAGNFLRVADVLAGEFHVEIFVGQFHAERRHRRAGHRVIHHAAPIRDALADRETDETHPPDTVCGRRSIAQRRIPRRIAQIEGPAVWMLATFAGKKCRGDFRQRPASAPA